MAAAGIACFFVGFLFGFALSAMLAAGSRADEVHEAMMREEMRKRIADGADYADDLD